MACYHPIEVQVRAKAPLSGLWPVTVGCGSCIGCRADQARQWAVRILHERQLHDAAWFLTLTYSDERLPENGSLRAKDLSGFFKALRRRVGEVRYFACGEYGERTQRPHYHAVLFGPWLLDRCVVRADEGGDVWRSESLEACWPHGFSEFGTVTAASASYVAGYVRKKVSRKAFPNADVRVDAETGELVDVEPEFARMSLRPAIGRRWIERYWRDVYPRDFVVFDGGEYKPPRYYDKWMDANHPEVMVNVRERRGLEAQEMSPYKLAAAEKIHLSRSSLFESRGGV